MCQKREYFNRISFSSFVFYSNIDMYNAHVDKDRQKEEATEALWENGGEWESESVLNKQLANGVPNTSSNKGVLKKQSVVSACCELERPNPSVHAAGLQFQLRKITTSRPFPFCQFFEASRGDQQYPVTSGRPGGWNVRLESGKNFSRFFYVSKNWWESEMVARCVSSCYRVFLEQFAPSWWWRTICYTDDKLIHIENQDWTRIGENMKIKESYPSLN